MDDVHISNEFGSKYNVTTAVQCSLIYKKVERAKLSELQSSRQITWQRLSLTPHFSLRDERRFTSSHEHNLRAM